MDVIPSVSSVAVSGARLPFRSIVVRLAGSLLLGSRSVKDQPGHVALWKAPGSHGQARFQVEPEIQTFSNMQFSGTFEAPVYSFSRSYWRKPVSKARKYPKKGYRKWEMG